MPTCLSTHSDRLSVQLRTLTSGFNRHLTLASNQRLLDRTALREGLISSLWQAWCRFLRSVILTSASGGTTSGGVAITCIYSTLSQPQVLHVAKQLSTGSNIGTFRSLAGAHLEPTWGDIDKAIAITAGMGLSNSAQILSALSLSTSIQDLQICRNATAHVGPSLLSRLKTARVRYVDTKILHPTDACLWIDPGTYGYLWDSWVEEMNLIAENACQ